MNNNNICVDIADYITILSHNGKIAGIVSSCKIDEVENIFDETLKTSLSNAKGILVNFQLNKEQTLLTINDFMAKINEYSNEEADIIFSSEVRNDIDENIIGFQILVTGL